MSAVELSDQEWGQLMSIISDAPWKVANPLLMKIGNQLREQAMTQQQVPAESGIRLDGNGKEVSHE